MNALTQTFHRPGERLAELDPFEAAGTRAEVEPETADAYGCVDWYIYGEEGGGHARARSSEPCTPAGRSPVSDVHQH
jgi:hypothetical protein